ncbi:MAG: hypothetical protein ACJ77H_07550 [Actinomycetota bacterium]
MAEAAEEGGGLVAAPAGPAVEQAAGDALVAVGQQERGPVELVVVEHLPVGVQGGGRVALGRQEGRLQVPPAGPARARAAVVAGVGGDDRVHQRPRLGRGQAGPQRGRQAEEGVDHPFRGVEASAFRPGRKRRLLPSLSQLGTRLNT